MTEEINNTVKAAVVKMTAFLFVKINEIYFFNPKTETVGKR